MEGTIRTLIQNFNGKCVHFKMGNLFSVATALFLIWQVLEMLVQFCLGI